MKSSERLTLGWTASVTTFDESVGINGDMDEDEVLSDAEDDVDDVDADDDFLLG